MSNRLDVKRPGRVSAAGPEDASNDELPRKRQRSTVDPDESMPVSDDLMAALALVRRLSKVDWSQQSAMNELQYQAVDAALAAVILANSRHSYREAALPFANDLEEIAREIRAKAAVCAPAPPEGVQ